MFVVIVTQPRTTLLFQTDDDDDIVCHRVINVTNLGEIVTKGDANMHDDRWLLPSGQMGFKPQQILGKAFWRIPRLGYPVLLIRETYWAKVQDYFYVIC